MLFFLYISQFALKSPAWKHKIFFYQEHTVIPLKYWQTQRLIQDRDKGGSEWSEHLVATTHRYDRVQYDTSPHHTPPPVLQLSHLSVTWLLLHPTPWGPHPARLLQTCCYSALYSPALTVTASMNCSRQEEVPTTRDRLAFFRSLSTVL